MTCKVLVVGMDSADATLLERWAALGYLPNIAELIPNSTVAKLNSSLDVLPAAIWPEITSGRSSSNTGLFNHFAQLHTGEASLRPVGYDEIDPADNYWSHASNAGRRVCVIDQVQTVVNPELSGIQVQEWGLHDRHYGEKTHPEGLLQEIHDTYGRHPVGSCDTYDQDESGREALLNDLISGARVKRKLVVDLMAREDWDLFTCVLGESHCAGHQLWHCHDKMAPWHDPTSPPRHRNAIRSVYQELDATIGALREAAGKDATTLVLASHGLGPSRAGYHLVDEILVRLGMSSNEGSGALQSGLRDFKHKIGRAVPRSWVPFLRKMAYFAPLKKIQSQVGALQFPLEAPQTKAAAVSNNRVGAIRLNIKGREPFGSVSPGEEAEALLEELKQALGDIKCPKTHQPIVERTMTAAEAFGDDHHPDMPDLLIKFTPGRTPIEACYSERAGLIEIPYYSNRVGRSGDHRDESRIWATGPQIAHGQRLEGHSVLDIAPTILDLLGVKLPSNLDGVPMPLLNAHPGQQQQSVHASAACSSASSPNIPARTTEATAPAVGPGNE